MANKNDKDDNGERERSEEPERAEGDAADVYWPHSFGDFHSWRSDLYSGTSKYLRNIEVSRSLYGASGDVVRRRNTGFLTSYSPSRVAFADQTRTWLDSQSKLTLATFPTRNTVFTSIAAEGVHALSEITNYRLGGASALISSAIVGGSLYNRTLTDRVKGIASDYTTSISALVSGAQLAESSRSFLYENRLSHAGILADQRDLYASGVSVLTDFARAGSAIDSVSPWTVLAPTIEPYLSSRVIRVLAGSAVVETSDDEHAEEAVNREGEEIETRLATIDRAFLEPYRGAISAITVQSEDWRRHVAVSVRELMEHLLRKLAPDAELQSYYQNPTNSEYRDGNFTRHARLSYVFRNALSGNYARMAEQDIELVEATFYPANTAIHTLVAPFSEADMRLFISRIKGCLLVVLTAAES